MGGVVLVYAFDPLDELDGRMGVIGVDDELAGRLIAEHRVERVEDYKNDPLRFVTGSAANLSAGEALRGRRHIAVDSRKARKASKLEGG